MPKRETAWSWFIDDLIPNWVKQNYSPKESWKKHPFSPEDARFFMKGIKELSILFTEDRQDLPTRASDHYFQHSRFRSAYLLHFLPFQAAKFLHLLNDHREASLAAYRHGVETGVLRVVDVGAGPGTASFAFILFLLEEKKVDLKKIKKVEFHWCDIDSRIMADGKKLMEAFAERFPSLKGKIEVRTQKTPWVKWRFEEESSLVFLGHVLNEGRLEQRSLKRIAAFYEQSRGGGVLFVEPSSQGTSQLVSRLRDELIEGIEDLSLWGPCLHLGRCPMSSGRDWCHFSAPVKVGGKWYRYFSQRLRRSASGGFRGRSSGEKKEREFIKYSYLWLASLEVPTAMEKSDQRLVVSDPLTRSGKQEVLLCEPERVRRLPLGRKKLRRGDLVKAQPRGSGRSS